MSEIVTIRLDLAKNLFPVHGANGSDQAAICEAATHPKMRFVPVKSDKTQGVAMVFRIRELLIRQRTQAINALRGDLKEFRHFVPQGTVNAAKLIAIVEDPDSGLPAIPSGRSKSWSRLSPISSLRRGSLRSRSLVKRQRVRWRCCR